MLQLREVVGLLDCEVVCGEGHLDSRLAACFAADLMSDVLAYSSPDALLITGLTSVQSVHTAHVADCAGILFVSGKRPSPEALQLARSKDIPVLSTKRGMFESCGILHRQGLPAAARA